MKNRIFAICNLRFAILGIALTLVFSGILQAQIASGGDFTLEQQVIAGGGGDTTDSSGVIFKIEGTLGQKAAGTLLTGGDFTQRGGFWSPLFSPTAANASIRGRAVIDKDRGIKDAFVTLTGGLLTAPRVARTNQFGYFNFEGVETGHFYILQVRRRNLQFLNDTESFTLNEDMSEIVFRAISNQKGEVR